MMLVHTFITCWTVAAVEGGDRTRARTAPTTQQLRKQWQAASVEVKTDSGSHVRIKAPGSQLHLLSYIYVLLRFFYV